MLRGQGKRQRSNKITSKRLVNAIILLLLLATALFLALMLHAKDPIQIIHYRSIAGLLTLMNVTLILTKDYFIKKFKE